MSLHERQLKFPEIHFSFFSLKLYLHTGRICTFLCNSKNSLVIAREIGQLFSLIKPLFFNKRYNRGFHKSTNLILLEILYKTDIGRFRHSIKWPKVESELKTLAFISFLSDALPILLTRHVLNRRSLNWILFPAPLHLSTWIITRFNTVWLLNQWCSVLWVLFSPKAALFFCWIFLKLFGVNFGQICRKFHPCVIYKSSNIFVHRDWHGFHNVYVTQRSTWFILHTFTTNEHQI